LGRGYDLEGIILRGEGAIVFLVIFVIGIVVTLAYPTLPPGMQIYSALGVATTTYLVLGIQATTLVEAIFNGVVYGIIVWIIFTIARGASRPKTKTQPQQTQQSMK
jgi:4-hydroxybenzoate polyprenyltransferase